MRRWGWIFVPLVVGAACHVRKGTSSAGPTPTPTVAAGSDVHAPASKMLRAGLELATSIEPSLRVLGWSALSAIIHRRESTETSMLDQIESSAANAATKESADALVELYRMDLARRNARLASDAGASIDAPFAAAVLALDIEGPTTPPPPHAPESDTSERAVILALAGATTPQDMGSPRAESLTALLASDSDSTIKKLAAMLLVRRPALASALVPPRFGVTSAASDIVDRLTECAQDGQRESSSALDREFGSSCRAALGTMVVGHSLPQLSLAADIARPGTVLAPSTGGAPLPGLTVKAEPTLGSRVWHDQRNHADATQLVPFSQIYQGPPWMPPQGAKYSCLKGSYIWTGSCFTAAVRNVAPGDAAALPVIALGVDHRTWYAQSGGSTVAFHVRTTYEPRPETLWLAVRWSGGALTGGALACTTGCINPTPVVVEPNTRWGILPVIPGAPVTFDFAFTATVQAENAGYMGIMFAAETFEHVEIIEFSAPTATIGLSSPLLTNARAKSDNGLLAYVATMTTATLPSGWLAYESGNLASGTLSVLARLDLLAQIAAQDAAAFAGPAPTPKFANSIQTGARQQFLRTALAPVYLRMFQTTAGPLEQDIKNLRPLLVALRLAKMQLNQAMSALDTLSQDEAFALLGTAADVSGVERPPIIASKDQLIAAIIGADHAVEQLLIERETQFRLTCEALKRLQMPGLPAPLSGYVSRPEVLGQCER